MSAGNQVAGPSRSIDNFTPIFEAAKKEYKRLTRKDIDTHRFAAELDNCRTSGDFSNVVQGRADAFNSFRERDEKLMRLLRPIIHVLFIFSATVVQGTTNKSTPASTIVTGICVLLQTAKDVEADNDKLTDLFERIHFFLQRLNKYIKMPCENEWMELLGKIMAHVLVIVGLSTKAMKEWRIKKFAKKLIGRKDVEDAFNRIDSLTKDETIMAVAKTLEVAFDIDGNIQGLKALVGNANAQLQAMGENLGMMKEDMDERQRDQLSERLQRWLSPPDPSTNHDKACKTHLEGSAKWFIEGATFREWKEKKIGPLLWISGNPGCGKTILCSAIIEDIRKLRKDGSALVAHYYFDFNDATKRDISGLLASLLSQLSYNSDHFRDMLYELYKTSGDRFERPKASALEKCLKTMVELPGQPPIFIIIDALDECPSITGLPSARGEVLDFVESLVRLNCPNLFICITCRHEQDIQTVFNGLTSELFHVSLHDESGQKDDIINYVRHVVDTNRDMQAWREDDKELIFNTLSKRAGGMFRWVFCQLEALRQCFTPDIRKTLNELPTTLDETYERTLERIPKKKQQHAHRLLQCLVAAIRPLRVEELGQIFAMGFDTDATPTVKEGWRLDNLEEAMLSACSNLITIIDHEGSKVVQFSHFTVKEFLISDRLRRSEVDAIRQYHIPIDIAHTILAQACLKVLLQLDKGIHKNGLSMFPLAFYAAQHWFEHAKYEDVASRVQDDMQQLFNPNEPHLAAWVWLHDVDRNSDQQSIDRLTDHPSRPKETALYYAVSCGLSGPTEYLISTHGQDVDVKCSTGRTLLQVVSGKGNLDAVSLLLHHGTDVNLTSEQERTPLCEAYDGGHLEVMGLLLENSANPDVRYDHVGLLTYHAACVGRAKAMRLLLEHRAEVNAISSFNCTPLHWASTSGHANVVEMLLERGADINAVSDFGTPLFLASYMGRYNVAWLLIERKADMHIRGINELTPFQAAKGRGKAQVAELLLEHGAKGE